MRFEFATFKLFDAQGTQITPVSAASRFAQGQESIEIPVWLESDAPPLRAIGTKTKEGQIVWLLTDLSGEQLATVQARELYRSRWQIELLFKRMKSLLDLGDLPTRSGPTARSWIFAKLILAALAILVKDEVFSPWEVQRTLENLRQRRLDSPACPPKTSPKAQENKAKGSKEKTRATHLLEV